jgi:hypothetical protein
MNYQHFSSYYYYRHFLEEAGLAEAGPELLDSSDPPTSTSRAVVTTGTCHHVKQHLSDLLLVFPLTNTKHHRYSRWPL